MVDGEQTKTPDTSGSETDKIVEDKEKPLSLVDEAKAIRDEIIKQKEELKTENDRKEKINAESLLSGNSGGHIEKTDKKEETPQEYNTRIDKELSEGQHDD